MRQQGSRWRVGAVVFALTVGVTAAAWAEEPAAPAASFVSPRTVVWLDRTQIIPVKVGAPADADRPLEAKVDQPGIVEVLRQPVVLKGESIAYLRVRGLQAGRATITLGDAKLAVEVAPSPSESASVDPRPVVVGPASGAVVWGKITLGVEAYDDPHRQGPPPAVSLRLPDGQTLKQPREVHVSTPPTRRLVFEVDTANWPEGPGRVVAEVVDADGRKVVSEPLTLVAARPDASAIFADECENHLEPGRPNQPGVTGPRVGSDPAASGGRHVVCVSAEPMWGFSYEVKEAGLYQVIVTARGDYGAGAFPSIGVTFGESDRAVTASRLVDHGWQRTPVGFPVKLEAGKQFLGVRFLNDFYAPDNYDRNVYLDRFEIVKVADAGKSDAPANAMAMMAPAMAMDMGGAYGQSDDLRIALHRPIHGLPIRGDLTLIGIAWWKENKTVAPPRCRVIINGEPLMEQVTADPVFRVSPGYFKPGENTVQIAAELENGLTAESPVETITLPESAVGGAARPYYRFGPTDAAWGDTLKKLLKSPQHQDGHLVAMFLANGEATLTLPDDLEGPHELYLDLRGDQFEGSPIAEVKLRVGDEVTPIAQQAASQYWNDHKVGKVELPKGPKQLVVAFTNDEHKPGVGDRNLWLRAVSLRGLPGEPDKTPPAVKLLYPQTSHVAGSADAVVVNVSDDDGLAWVDLIVDDRRLGMNADLEPALGPIVFPLLCRSLEPGEHRVRVRAEDRSGNQGDSEEITFTVAPDAAASGEVGRYERAVRLLDRFAFGPAQQELADVLVMGERAYLEDRLSRSLDDPGERAAYGKARVLFPGTDGAYDIGVNTVHHLQMTPNPVRARFVLWAENRFSTWIRKTEGWRKRQEHEAFARVGVAPFLDLLMTSATSPAMLVYLDQQRSFATSLNENYAREVMELHTLGVNGGYTQADVTSLAGVLNGWTATDEAATNGVGYPLASVFRFDGRLNDGQPRRVLGMSFDAAPVELRYDRVRMALEMLAAHPSTAEHVCRDLVEHYVRVPAPDTMVKDLARVFHETGGDLRRVLLAMVEHEEFRRADLPPKVARPIDFALRVSRATRADDVWPIVTTLQSSGMGMFECVTPNGYPEEDERYADSNALLQRWKLVRQWEWRVASLTPGQWRWQAKVDQAAWAQNVIDALAVRLTGRVLGEKSNAAALEVLTQATGDRAAQTSAAAVFIGTLPESSLR